MARDENGRKLPDVYAGLSDRRAVEQPFLDLSKEERKERQRVAYDKLHPRQKFWRELGAWGFTVVFAYAFRNSDLANASRWGGVLLIAYLGWVFPVFRAWQWYINSRD